MYGSALLLYMALGRFKVTKEAKFIEVERVLMCVPENAATMTTVHSEHCSPDQ